MSDIIQILHRIKLSARRREFRELEYLLDQLDESVREGQISNLESKHNMHEIDRLFRFIRHYHLPSIFLKKIESIQNYIKKNSKEEKKKIYQKNLSKIEKIKLKKSDNLTFFLGAGASIPRPSSIPGVNDLLPVLWEKANKLGKPELDKLRKYCEEHNITNIEDLLTSALIADFCITNPNILQLLSELVYTEESDIEEFDIREKEIVSSFRELLDTLFSLLCGTMIKGRPNEIHKSIASFNKYKMSIITTNYDICIDTALSDSNVEYTYEINNSVGRKKISLIKMHGSINWFYCNACQNIKVLNIEDMSQIMDGHQVLAVTGMCPDCPGLTRLLLVPPTSFKYVNYPTLIPLWNSAQDCFKNSRMIIFTGYSFSDSDDYISKMLTNALRSNPEICLVIIDKSEDTILRLKKLISLHIETYNQDKHLISFIGDADTILPEVLKKIEAI